MKTDDKKIKGYKGFNADMTCRGFQYEVGKTYEMEEDVKVGKKGFHFCENPFDVFAYYHPAGNMYCEVEGSGKTDKYDGDSIVACSRLNIKAETGLTGLINAGVKLTLDKVDWGNKKKESDTGDYSAATNTGYRSAASVSGEESIAIVTGKDSKAKGAKGCWIVLTERDDEYDIVGVKAFKVDGKAIKADTYYQLKNGEIKEAK